MNNIFSTEQKKNNPGTTNMTKCNKQGRENYYSCEILKKKKRMLCPLGLIRALPMWEKDYCFLFFSLQKVEMDLWRASCRPVSFGLRWNKSSLISANLTVRHVVCAAQTFVIHRYPKFETSEKKQIYCGVVLFGPSGGCVAVDLRRQLSLTSHLFCDGLL